jgi:molecular chaperone DnaK
MIFQTENQLQEIGDKIPAQHKHAIEQALQQLKDAHKAGDIAAIDTAMAALNTAWQTASQQMYQGAGAQAGPQPDADQQQGPFYNQQAGGSQQSTSKDDNIQDADFEEVK